MRPQGGAVLAYEKLLASYVALLVVIICRPSSASAQWVQTSGPPLGIIHVFLVDSTTGYIFAGTSGNGVYVSSNSGISWSPSNTGIENVGINAMARHGRNLFAGTGQGVYRSTDNGDTWTTANSGFPETLFVDVLLPVGQSLLAGTGTSSINPYDGLYFSTDQGSSWAAYNLGFGPVGQVHSIAASSNRLAITLSGGMSDGVLLSTNGGVTWNQTGGGGEVGNLCFLADTLFASFGCDGVYRMSLDSLQWQRAGNLPACTCVNSILADGTTIYIGTGGCSGLGGPFAGIYYSTNGGKVWTQPISDLYDIHISALAKTSTGLLAGTGIGVFVSPDSGLHWSWVNDGFPSISTVYSLSFIGNRLFAGIDHGDVNFTNDHGNSWTRSAAGMGFALSISSLASRGADLFALAREGVYHTSDVGASWTVRDSGLPRGDGTPQIIVDGSDLFVSNHPGLFSSSDDGVSWVEVDSGLPGNPPEVISLAALGGDVFTATNEGVFRSSNRGHTWMAANAGLDSVRSWNASAMSVIQFGASRSTLLASAVVYVLNEGERSQGIYRFDPDSGKWFPSNTGLPADTFQSDPGLLSYPRISCFTSEGDYVFAGTKGRGVFASSNGGGAWVLLDTALTDHPMNARDILSLVAGDGYLFAGSYGSGVWRWPLGRVGPTAVGGWNMVSLPVTVPDARTSAVFPTAASNAFTYNGSGYVVGDTLRNGEAYWLKFSGATDIPFNGPPILTDTVTVLSGWNMIGSITGPVSCGSINSVPPGIATSRFFGFRAGYFPSDTIYPGKGYWVKVDQAGQLVLSSSGLTSTRNRIRIVATRESPPAPPNSAESNASVLPLEHTLQECYPNPFNPSTSISFTIPNHEHVRLQVFNLLGQLITTLVNQDKEPGTYSVTWDASANSSGLYFYRMTAGEFLQTRKAILLR
jgi:hypothetical protein